MKKLCSAVFIIILFFGCTENKIDKSTNKIDSLKHTIQSLIIKNDSLQQLADSLAANSTSWFYNDRAFQNKGIKNPKAFIKLSLQNRPELIPLEPVLGGTMHFTKMKVLGKEWIVAHYEDGHIMGQALYSYELQKDTTIEFEVLIATRPQ